jgi:hypothetical protein
MKDAGASQQTDVRPKQDRRREVTYGVFAHEIWPKIIKKLQVGHRRLVFIRHLLAAFQLFSRLGRVVREVR